MRARHRKLWLPHKLHFGTARWAKQNRGCPSSSFHFLHDYRLYAGMAESLPWFKRVDIKLSHCTSTDLPTANFGRLTRLALTWSMATRIARVQKAVRVGSTAIRMVATETGRPCARLRGPLPTLGAGSENASAAFLLLPR